ncbi:ABC transporter ATP-binding protein [Lacibacterium aquatile]|uniref:ABC transporter ATP-binding protein n=1 Tax=Lacibacterium aquatile TaxID=1168082 RepID=A0ABW5DN58_9PROT
MAKIYPPAPPVLDSIDISIKSGEFFTLLGPSGCGKTTLLRIIAGFLRQDSGAVVVNGEAIDHLPPHKRDVGMVFQDYAIFPHLTVAQNVAFGLKARKVSPAEIETRVAESLRTVRLDALADRLPSELSGGQQQRVGLARAMVIRPKLLLMDEPLSNLDAKLRIELREDIRDIQQRLGITTIYVTHDQEEALAISDRICVMNKGKIEQLDPPFDLYRHPKTRFAANFVGTMNFLPATLSAGALTLGGQEAGFKVAGSDGAVSVAIRPENVVIRTQSSAAASAGELHLSGTVTKSTFLGKEAHYTLKTPIGDLVAQVFDPTQDLLQATGQAVDVLLPLNKLVVFGADEKALPITLGGA